MSDRIGLKARTQALEAENERLKKEGIVREEQLQQIKKRFSDIREELKFSGERLINPSSRDDQVFAKVQAKKLTSATETGTRLKKQLVKVQQERDDYEAKLRRMQSSQIRWRSTSGERRTTNRQNIDSDSVAVWKKKFRELKAEMTKLQHQQQTDPKKTPKVHPALRALKQRKMLGNVQPNLLFPQSPDRTHDEIEVQVIQSQQRSPEKSSWPPQRTQRPVLMNAWVQTKSEPTQTNNNTIGSVISYGEVEVRKENEELKNLLQSAMNSTTGLDNVAKRLIDSLRRENVSQRQHIESITSKLESITSRYNILLHEHELLEKQIGPCQATNDDIASLKREIVEKNAKLILLDSRFQQAQKATESLKNNQGDLITELQKLNNDLTDANAKSLEALNALEVSKIGASRAEGLQIQLSEKDDEVRLLNMEVDRLMQKCHTTRSEITTDLRVEWEEKFEEKKKLLEDSERNNKKLFRDVQLITEQRDEFQQKLIKTQVERDVLDSDAINLRTETESLRERIKLFGSNSSVEDEEDIHKALALVKHHRSKGDPTDLEFLMRAWDTPGAELTDLRADNVKLERELDLSKRMIESRNQRIEYEIDRAAGLRQVSDDKNNLIENMGERMRRLTDEMSRYRGIGKKLSTDSDVESIAVGDDENVLEISVEHLIISDQHQTDTPNSYFVSIDFLDFETVTTEVLSGNSVVFSKTFCFTIEVSPALRHYIRHNQVPVELHKAEGLGYKSIAKGNISLVDLLAPACTSHRSHLQLVDQNIEEIGIVEFSLKLKTSLPSSWIGFGAEDQQPAPSLLVFSFRHVRALKLVVHECRNLKCSSDPIPYVLATVTSPVVIADEVLGDVTIELPHRIPGANPVFHHSHEYPIKYVLFIVCHFERWL